MSSTLDIRFLDSRTLGRGVGTEDVVRVFLSMGFTILEFEVEGHVQQWPKERRIAVQFLQAADRAMRFGFRAWHEQCDLEVRQSTAWSLPGGRSVPWAWIVTRTDNTPYFWRPEYSPAEYSRLFVNLGKELYGAILPSFGWIDFDYGLRTTHEDIESLELPALYWANFFGVRYVEKIGRDRIETAPGCRIEELPDGGLLMVLASGPGLSDDHASTTAVGAHFGVLNVR